jgi:hypothetical protein
MIIRAVTLNIFRYIVCSTLVIVLSSSMDYHRPAQAGGARSHIDITNMHKSFFGDPKIKEPEMPELYIDPTLKYGLNLVLPQSVQKRLNFDSGYDRWEGLPTMQMDYFLPVSCWSDKSLFVAPRISLTGARESLSIGAGFRRMITADSMIGFHVFQDWVRPRRSKGEFLKELGVGAELSVLPGYFSDLSLSANAYFPVNDRYSVKTDGNTLVREILPTGYDGKIGFQFPGVFKSIDIRLDGQIHSYVADATNITGYKTGLNVRSRNGLWSVLFEHGNDTRVGHSFHVEGSLTVALDWNDLLKGSSPFSAPYKVSDLRFNRKIHDSLYQRVARRHDLPMDRTETKVTLMAEVDDETLFFSGGFPKLPNAVVTLQTSQSPWEDCMDVQTDDIGAYSGRLNLPPGMYRIRFVHKATGLASNVKTIVVDAKKEAE